MQAACPTCVRDARAEISVSVEFDESGIHSDWGKDAVLNRGRDKFRSAPVVPPEDVPCRVDRSRHVGREKFLTTCAGNDCVRQPVRGVQAGSAFSDEVKLMDRVAECSLGVRVRQVRSRRIERAARVDWDDVVLAGEVLDDLEPLAGERRCARARKPPPKLDKLRLRDSRELEGLADDRSGHLRDVHVVAKRPHRVRGGRGLTLGLS